MVSPTNLTEQIAKLREKKPHSSVLNAPKDSKNMSNSTKDPRVPDPILGSRKLAYDYFTQFAYSLLLIALIGQLLLILSLELI